MCFSGPGPLGRLATRLASLSAPPYKGQYYLARLNPRGFVSPQVSLFHSNLQLGQNIFIGDRVVIFEATGGGTVKIGQGVHINQDCIIETGQGGSITIGEDTFIQPRCQFSGYKGSIDIGRGVQIAPNCAFYPYDHEFKPGELIKRQGLKSRAGIVIGDDAWLGFGVIVLDGARIGAGAVISAGSVVKGEIPDGAIAVGAPARVLRYRDSNINPR
jgi:acetyltransferase-like isoleucine patch superfamily enzyme